MHQTAQNLPKGFIYLEKKKTNEEITKKETVENLKDTIGRKELKENVELLYASSIFMSSKDCASGTCD